jgi:betaine reductase
VERAGREDLVVLLGTPNAESSELVALTLTEGDPTWAGPLAGVRLELPVYHITEPEVRDQIPPDVYDAQVGLVETVLDGPGIAEVLRRSRR